MRKLVIAPALLGTLLVAGAAHAQQHPWVPSGFNGSVGSVPDGSTPAVADQHPWVPSNVYTGNLPNGAPAYAASRAGAPVAAPAAPRRRTTDIK